MKEVATLLRVPEQSKRIIDLSLESLALLSKLADLCLVGYLAHLGLCKAEVVAHTIRVELTFILLDLLVLELVVSDEVFH